MKVTGGFSRRLVFGYLACICGCLRLLLLFSEKREV